VEGQWSFSESCRQVERLSHKYPEAQQKLIKDAANGPAIIDALKYKIPGIIPVKPEGGKLSRAQAAQARVEAGNVYLPNPKPNFKRIPERDWVDDFLYQLIIFPRGAMTMMWMPSRSCWSGGSGASPHSGGTRPASAECSEGVRSRRLNALCGHRSLRPELGNRHLFPFGSATWFGCVRLDDDLVRGVPAFRRSCIMFI
jgi:predicted phage terminase large subunit-like protein